MLLLFPRPTLIYFARKERRESSTVALGNNRLLRPSFHKPFYCQSCILFIHPLFSRSWMQTEPFRALSGIWSPETGFACSFITVPLPLLFFHCLSRSRPGFTPMYFSPFRIHHLWNCGVDYGWRNPLKISLRWRKTQSNNYLGRAFLQDNI